MGENSGTKEVKILVLGERTDSKGVVMRLMTEEKSWW